LVDNWGIKLNSTARTRVKRDSYYRYEEYNENPITQAKIIEGYFYKENLIKEMAIRKVNLTLCAILTFLVVGAFVSYYFSMSNEITLNTLSRQVTTLNDENSELQNHLDKLKSFNNVDSTMEQQNILQKAATVMEVPAVPTAKAVENKRTLAGDIDLAIGY